MKTIEIMTAVLQEYFIVAKRSCYITGTIICIALCHPPVRAIANGTPYYVDMVGKVKQHFYNHMPLESVVDSASITISNETKKITRTYYSDRSGKCQFKLPLDEQFEIQVSKKGYVTKILNVDTKIMVKKLSVYTIIFDIYLFEDIQGVDVSLLKAPIAKVIFDNDSNHFVYDRLYTYKIGEKIKELYREYYHLYINSSKINSNEPSQEYIVFQVQLIAMNNRLPLNSSLFSECGMVNECYTNGMYKYTVGEFRSLSSAQVLLSRIIFLGFTDAFIVAVKGKDRIPVRKAVTLLNQ